MLSGSLWCLNVISKKESATFTVLSVTLDLIKGTLQDSLPTHVVKEAFPFLVCERPYMQPVESDTHLRSGISSVSGYVNFHLLQSLYC